jgi:hypothetical protein
MQRMEDDRRIAEIILEGGEFPDGNGSMPLRSSADGHRSDRRRGLPVLSRGVCGTAPGTDPVGELLRKEARLERRR